uniref:Adenosine kinase n=1 Tax=Lygus hesperus TaxID=30085 RepID=A0A0A9ZJD8_LYGHE
MPVTAFPVCQDVLRDLERNPQLRGDTTGCGDNFSGGMLAYLSEAVGRKEKRGSIDMVEAMSWGMASGAFTLFSVGGTYIEKYAGEKRERIDSYRRRYLSSLRKAKL